MIYLASPYTHKDRSVVTSRYFAALRCTAILMNKGHHVFSPIVHCHQLAVHYDMPGDFEFWQGYDHHMIEVSSAVLVLAIPGWQESKGVTAELAFADKIVKAVSFVNRTGSEITEEQARCV